MDRSAPVRMTRGALICAVLLTLLHLGLSQAHDLAYVVLAGGQHAHPKLAALVVGLRTHLLPWTPGNVLIFHTGDYATGTAVRQNISTLLPDAQYHMIPNNAWQLPAGMKATDFRKGYHDSGYRHMCRWYTLGLFQYLDNLGYRWVLRLDSDSDVKSDVTHNLVKWMEDNKKQYGYRIWAADGPEVTWSLPEFTAWYLTATETEPTWLYEHCSPQNKTGLNSYGGWNGGIIYNNMFMTNITFWLSPKVHDYIDAVLRSHGIYLFRWGDAPIHTMVCSIFLKKSEMAQFKFQYCHLPVCVPKEPGDGP